MRKGSIAGILLILLGILLPLHASPSAGALVKNLLKKYNDNTSVLSRPVKNHSQPVVVIFEPSITKILDVDEQNQVFTIYVWRYHVSFGLVQLSKTARHYKYFEFRN
jgi:hypothetical protein